MELYEDQFNDKHDYPHQTDTRKTLIIASTVRSGSHMLGHVLHETGAFGFPLEYANSKNLQQWKEKLQEADTKKCMQAIMRRRTSPNGVFGIKVHYSHLPALGGFNALRQLFPNPHFVLLTRHDVMSQAVSLAMAKQTGSWIADQSKGRQPVYHAEDIDNGLRRILFENSSWKYTLSASGARYMDLNFDDVKANTANTVLRIADFMQQDIDSARIPRAPVTRKQSNELNQQWTARFIEQFNGNDELLRYNRESPLRRLARKFTK
ncbi:Stf0 family sulfotransferase [Salinimonas sediminis]|uniref:Stf0 sulfotransferase n=1 Tax=Salinimonas sediminis TaxID=2303538 RepID=A0A346NJ33_9ALTE|nr:Stf0 family sulfotransferase [Salinimonas sediminis]AXR05540.1 Stf0 sulfotransferase [Salinimonas sediminis]